MRRVQYILSVYNLTRNYTMVAKKLLKKLKKSTKKGTKIVLKKY